MKRIKITPSKYIGDKEPCFIVAEMSANHAQDFNLARKIVIEAKKCGADAVKVQTYLPETMTLPFKTRHFHVKHHKWGGQSLYELYKKAYMPWGWHKKLKKVADDNGIIFFSTPFDKRAVDLLERLNVPLYKVASYELTDIPLIKHIAQTKKPMIMSLGMATKREVQEAIDAAYLNGAKDIILLKCTSNYPAEPSNANLITLTDLRKSFGTSVGFSDHTLGFNTSIAAVALGAKVIEKHLTLSRSIKSPDSFFSSEPREIKELVDNVRIVEKAIGKVCYATKVEIHGRAYRRSIFVSENIKKGEIFNVRNIKVVRPAAGLKPKFFEKIIGKKARRNIKAGTPLRWDLTG